MHQMGDELYEKSKMLAKVQGKIAALEDEVEIWKSRAKTRCWCYCFFFEIIIGVGANLVSLMLEKILCMVNIS